jgi:hypothetical protein
LSAIFFGHSAVSSSSRIDEFGIATTTLNQAVHSITAVASALVAGDPQEIELADQISKDDCAISGVSRKSSGEPR